MQINQNKSLIKSIKIIFRPKKKTHFLGERIERNEEKKKKNENSTVEDHYNLRHFTVFISRSK